MGGRTARTLLAGFGLLSLAVLLAAAGLLLTAGLWMPMHDAPAPADAIVVLAGDARRAIPAAALYRRGFAPAVYYGRPCHDRAAALRAAGVAAPLPEDLVRQALLKGGVPAAALHPYGENLLSTVEEARALGGALPAGARRIIVVTSPFHCRRARLILRDVLPGRDVRMIAADNIPFPVRWWTRKDSSLDVVCEAAKFLFYFFGRPFCSAPPPACAARHSGQRP